MPNPPLTPALQGSTCYDANLTSSLIEVKNELASLRETVDLQGRALAKLTTMKSDLVKQNKEVKEDLLKQNNSLTKEVNQLIDQQKNQVESFHSTSKHIENNIFERVEQKMEEKNYPTVSGGIL